MNVKGFNLDHCGSSVPPRIFDSLLSLTYIFKNVQHLQIENGQMSYEGIYIMSQNGQYIEFLNRSKAFENKTTNFISVNTFFSPIVELEKLNLILGRELDWKRSEQATKITESLLAQKYPFYDKEDIGKDWFYIWSQSNQSKQEENVPIWIIDYANNNYNRSWNNKMLQSKDFDFKQIDKIRWNLSKEQINMIKINGSWLAEDIIEEGKIFRLFFNNPNGKKVEFEIIESTTERQGFESITFEKMNKGTRFPTKNDSSIDIFDENDTIRLEFNLITQ